VTATLVAIATVLVLGIMLSACGDKLEGKWKEKDGTRILDITQASGDNYVLTMTDSRAPGTSITLHGARQDDTIRFTGQAEGAAITVKPASGGLEAAFSSGMGDVNNYVFVK